MIVSRPNPGHVALQMTAVDGAGTPKVDITAAAVRVYLVDGTGTEIEQLPLTDLDLVVGGTTWRYLWVPSALAVGQYVVEYQAIDVFGAQYMATEDLSVHDFALQADVAFLRQIEEGRWRIIGDQMIFYGVDGVTPILTFDLKDQAGLPTMENVFERVPT
jgi:hypothetical protein